MASLYTETADRKRLARDAIGKLLNDTGTNFPAPKVDGEKRRKAK